MKQFVIALLAVLCGISFSQLVQAQQYPSHNTTIVSKDDLKKERQSAEVPEDSVDEMVSQDEPEEVCAWVLVNGQWICNIMKLELK